MIKKLQFSMAFALLLVCGKAQAQCPEGNQWGEVYLTTQAEVDAFAVNYPNCTEFAGSLFIGDVDLSGIPINITDLTPLSNITSVEGFAVYSTQVTSLSGLNNLTNAEWVDIMENHQLTSLSGLESIISLEFLFIWNNNQLTDISALQNIDPATFFYEIGTHSIGIGDNPLLSVCNLPNICTYLQNGGEMFIENNAGDCISEQAVLNACATSANQCPEGDVYLTTQAEVNQFIIDYPNCTELYAYLLVEGDDITDLSGLSNLTYIEILDLWENSQLASLSGLSNLTSAEGLWIYGHDSLSSLSGLENLTYVGEEALWISENNALTSISALNNLTSASYIDIQMCPQLTSLSGLENLTYAEGLFIGVNSLFEGNSLLTDISALQNVNPATLEWLRIWDNPMLEVCNLPNFCTYLQNGGYSEIEGNAGDCISEQAVLNACALSVNDNELSKIQAYPNPVKDILYFEKEVQKITITDLTGKVLVIQNNISQTDMSAFQNGIYLITIETENGRKDTRKVVKK